jgi:hypothetical protein
MLWDYMSCCNFNCYGRHKLNTYHCGYLLSNSKMNVISYKQKLTDYSAKYPVWGCIQKFPDWPPGVITANGTALCHKVQLYLYFVSESSEFCCHNPLCCFSTSNTKGKLIFHYWLNPETFWYTLVCWGFVVVHCVVFFPILILKVIYLYKKPKFSYTVFLKCIFSEDTQNK